MLGRVLAYYALLANVIKTTAAIAIPSPRLILSSPVGMGVTYLLPESASVVPGRP
jgi:hypothetical protein